LAFVTLDVSMHGRIVNPHHYVWVLELHITSFINQLKHKINACRTKSYTTKCVLVHYGFLDFE
jgi:hypothetical protein